MRTTKLLNTALAGAVALLAACSDTTGGSGPGPGSLSFNYGGDRVGSYSASGTYRPRGSSFDKVPFAVGVRSSGSDLAVLSYQPVTSTTGNMVLLAVPGVTGNGSYSLASDNCGSNDCPLALLVFDTNPDLEEDDSQVFAFSSGTLTVTSISGGRMTGTFSGTAETLFADSVITITNGSFDLPVRSGGTLATRAKAQRQLNRHARPE
jgi:hypothetical protein